MRATAASSTTPTAWKYHFLVGSGGRVAGRADSRLGDRWRRQIMRVSHFFTRARDAGSIARSAWWGNFELPEHTPSRAQLAAAIALARAIAARFGIAPGAITTHTESTAASRSAPGKNFPLDRIRQALARTPR
jgi:N-acetyl-anhydromuramyl-L-alanine amidase AmpD